MVTREALLQMRKEYEQSYIEHIKLASADQGAVEVLDRILAMIDSEGSGGAAYLPVAANFTTKVTVRENGASA